MQFVGESLSINSRMYQHVVEITSVGTYMKWWENEYEHVYEYEV